VHGMRCRRAKMPFEVVNCLSGSSRQGERNGHRVGQHQRPQLGLSFHRQCSAIARGTGRCLEGRFLCAGWEEVAGTVVVATNEAQMRLAGLHPSRSHGRLLLRSH
jgi:hypothetical protein